MRLLARAATVGTAAASMFLLAIPAGFPGARALSTLGAIAVCIVGAAWICHGENR